MSCPMCAKSVKRKGKAAGCRIRYCLCGICNHCHKNGICPNGKHWFTQKKIGNGKGRQHWPKFQPGQSHGGHGFVPGCKRCY